MSREELMKLKRSELDVMCRERKITLYVGKNHISKTEMIDRILEYDNNNSTEENLVPMPGIEKLEELKNETNGNKKHSGTTIGEMVNMDEIKGKLPVEENSPWVLGNKSEAIEKADVGTVVAFLDEKGKPRTAKLVNRSSSRQVIKVVTEFEWTFIVPYDKVLWVRFGTRWPKAVYNMLKGYKNGKQPNIAVEAVD